MNYLLSKELTNGTFESEIYSSFNRVLAIANEAQELRDVNNVEITDIHGNLVEW